jgi:hypothetical protein
MASTATAMITSVRTNRRSSHRDPPSTSPRRGRAASPRSRSGGAAPTKALAISLRRTSIPAAAGDHNEKQEHGHLGHQQAAIGGLSSDDRDYPVPEGRRRHRPLPVVTAARRPPRRTASARSPMLGADRGRRRAVRAQPASTASARPLVIALNIPAVIRVVESTNGETISQAPSGSSVSVGQDCWRRPCSVAPSRRYLHRASLLVAWRRQRTPRPAASVPRLLAAHAVPEQPHCRFASALAGGMSAVRWGRSGTVGS